MPKKGYKQTLEHRAKIAAAGRGRTPSEETKAKISATLRTPEVWAKLSAASKGREFTPEHRANLSASVRRSMTPEVREKIAAPQRGREFSLETRKKMSEGRKRYFDTCIGKEVKKDQAVANHFVGTTALRYVLRERDGDLCQLCLEPVNFTLTVKTGEGWSASVDHVTPVRAGGSNDLDNLWLSHLSCNHSKSACFIGRKDGTTDVRTVR